ncbi:MAG: hypothetical protein KF901_11020 [Myxococcales bacterium]|nr:hypothetical protein [Myxococcales bacterium]
MRLERLLHSFLTETVDPARVRARARTPSSHSKRSAGADAPSRLRWPLAKKSAAGRRPVRRGAVDATCERYARRAALRAFVLGMPGGVFAPLAGLLDAGGTIALRTELAAVLLLREDPALFDDPAWRRRVVRAAYALPEDADALDDVAKRALVDELLRRSARFIARRVAVKLVPVAGGALSAGLAYVWMRREGSRIAAHARRESRGRRAPSTPALGRRAARASSGEERR